MQYEAVDPGEVLTGVRLFQYLIKRNESQLKGAWDKLHEYTKLQETLNSITKQCRRQVLAPVAGGLAYFDAELISTNNILVLLGENWFAERSVMQAISITERRLDFLRREVQVLEEEKKTLQQRQDMFASEIPEANTAMKKLMKKTEECLSEALMSSHGPCSDNVIPKGSLENIAREGPAVQDLIDRAVTEDPQLAVFDEQDELTEEELVELEKELGDVLDNDEVVERVLVARMIAKKERRIKAEVSRNASSKKVPSLRIHEASECTRHTTRSPKHDQSECRVSPELRVESSKCVFSSPADIGFKGCSAGPGMNLTGTTPLSLIEKASSLSEHSIMRKGDSLPKTCKRVTFTSEYADHTNNSSTSLIFSASNSMQNNKSIENEVMPKEPRPKKDSIHDAIVPGRESFSIKDIVERNIDSGSNSIPAFGSLSKAEGCKTRRSLFKRHLEGEIDDAV
ncbi:unnamed protein product [Phytomonas sp. EM1]|nr:unnamed protein product [Phytomonas sp. EM1]|eukprot:CCW60361.1 unnamed protein product [Phytomonas sp. isolate EM1]